MTKNLDGSPGKLEIEEDERKVVSSILDSLASKNPTGKCLKIENCCYPNHLREFQELNPIYLERYIKNVCEENYTACKILKS